MRQKIFSSIEQVCKIGNTHLGSVLIGLAGGYFITRATRQKELIKMDKELNDERETVKNLKIFLQQVLEKGKSEKFKKQDCLRRLDFVRYAFANSYCLFHQRYPGDIKLIGTPKSTDEGVTLLRQK